MIDAEQWRPGGEMLRGDDAATAALFGTLLASLVALATDIDVGGSVPGAVLPPLPNPEWVRWDDDGPGPWPAIPYLDDRAATRSLPGGVEDAAHRIRERMAPSRLPRVLGHADWETQNLRWHGTTPGPCTMGTASRGCRRPPSPVPHVARSPAPSNRRWYRW
ncbi:MAG TPA: hypothetical protein VGJ63_21945 [Micromonosporaceae bacterium]